MIPLFPIPEPLPAERFDRLPKYVRTALRELRSAYVKADDTLREMYRRRDKVLELHSPEGEKGYEWCPSCIDEAGDTRDWPCPTYRAISGDARPDHAR